MSCDGQQLVRVTKRQRRFIGSPTGRIAAYEVSVAGTTVTTTTRYFLTDHLGSIDAILPANGDVTAIARSSFDAYGIRRAPDSWSTLNASAPSQTLLGYTGHEQLDSLGLVHMNGRLYDPALGRFLSADPNIDGAGNTQGYNRYCYVHNSPLSGSDPSGYFNLSQEWNNFRDTVNYYSGVDATNKYLRNHEWAQQVVVAVATVYGGAWGAAIASGYMTSLYTHDSGAILTSAFVAGVTSAMSSGISGGDIGTANWAASVGSGHGVAS